MKTIYWFWLGSLFLGCTKAENEKVASSYMRENATFYCDRTNYEIPSEFIANLNRSIAKTY